MILDESGSMGSIREDMLKSINDLIEKQKTVDRPCRFTLVKFNQHINRKISSKQLQDVNPLKNNDYLTSGTTALYDAIGDTVDWYRYEEHVLLVIVTDGQENSSKTYRLDEIKSLLDEKNKNRGWTYVYLANDLSVARQGDTIGCNKSAFSSNCQVAQESYGKFIKNDLSKAIKKSRVCGQSVQEQLNHKY